MQACGIVVEYNPFHNGHEFHVQQARKASGADVVVAVMSGNFCSEENRQSLTNGSVLELHSKMAWI